MVYLEFELLLGGEFPRVLGELVDSARRRIYLASYVASLGGVVEDVYYGLAAKRRSGVDVRVVLDGVSRGALRLNRGVVELLRSLGVDCRLTRRLLHVKLYIVDDYSIVGSHNLVDPSATGRLDLSVMVYSRELADQLSNILHWVLEGGSPPPAVYRGVVGDAYYEVHTGYSILHDVYEKTRLAGERVKAMMYIASLSRATERYYRLLREKQSEGVDVAVLLDGSEQTRSHNKPVHDYLRGLGVERVMLSETPLHTKLLVIDDFVVTGSHNLTSASLAGRLELTLTLKHRRLADALNHFFENTWRQQLKRVGAYSPDSAGVPEPGQRGRAEAPLA